LEGPHLLEAALAAGIDIVEVFALEGSEVGDLPGDVHTVTAPVMARIAATDHPRGPVAVIAIPEPDALRRHDTVVLWDVADPGNAGSLVRSAAAFDCDLAVTPRTVDLWDPKVLRAAAGAHFGRALVSLGDDALADLAATGLTSVAAVVDGGRGPSLALAESGPVAILVGNEPHGLPASVIDAASAAVTIPMPGGVESLNVAVVGAILLYERRRLRAAS
jgi:TrmH family RNA methyltransferase